MNTDQILALAAWLNVLQKVIAEAGLAVDRIRTGGLDANQLAGEAAKADAAYQAIAAWSPKP